MHGARPPNAGPPLQRDSQPAPKLKPRMPRSASSTPLGSRVRRLSAQCLRLLASLQLAVVLIVLMAVVLAVATLLEASKGREFAQWYVYHSRWFIALLGVLAANILAATVVRFPWGFHRLPFLVTHAGLLVLLAGAVQTFFQGTEGRLSFLEGETSDRIVLDGRDRLTVRRPVRGRSGQGALEFTFEPGPHDWPEGQSLNLGHMDGVSLEVLRYYRHSEVLQQWIPSDSRAAVRGAVSAATAAGESDAASPPMPALRFELRGPGGEVLHEDWLVAKPMGTQLELGPLVIGFQQATANSFAREFSRRPPTIPTPTASLPYTGTGALSVSACVRAWAGK